MLSFPHLVVIFLVALVVLGPEKLPQVARALGKAMAEFNRITGDFRSQFDEEMRNLERQAHGRTAGPPPSVSPVQRLPGAQANPSVEVPAAASPGAVLPEAPGEPESPKKPADVESKPA